GTGAACGATNQVIFTVADLAGNVLKKGPYAILVDSTTPIAISTPTTPANGVYVAQSQPTFTFATPASAIAAGLGPNASYLIQVSSGDAGAFANVVINISTPVVPA